MKLMAYAVPLLPAMLLAQQPVDPASWPNWIVNGGVGAVAIIAIIRLINQHQTNIEKVTTEFRSVITAKDQQILDQGKEFQSTVKELSARWEATIKEMRQEHQKNVDDQFQLSREQIEALEHVTAGLSDLKGGLNALKQTVDHLTGKIDDLERGGRQPRKPPAGT